MNILNGILDYRAYKAELQYVYADEEAMVATDTKVLVVLKQIFPLPFEGKKCLIINEKAKSQLRIEEIIGQMPVNTSSASAYPIYKRIIPESNKIHDIARGNGIKFLYELTSKTGVVIDYVKYSSFLKKLRPITFEWYKYTDKQSVFSIGNDEYEIVFMPLVFKI